MLQRARIRHLLTAKELSEYNTDCCGACRMVWRWRWCEAMEATHEYSKWGLQGMCPVYAEEPMIF